MPLHFPTECLPMPTKYCHGWGPTDCTQIHQTVKSRVMLTDLSSAPDTKHIGTNQHHRHAAIFLGLWPWRVHRFRCHNADVHSHHSEIMFLSILTTTQHATIPLTTCLATLIWSLVISKVDYRQRLWSLSRGCHRTDVLCDVFSTHHPVTPPPSLDASCRADTIPPLCSDMPLSQRYSFILLCQHHLQLTLRDAAIFTRWHRQL